MAGDTSTECFHRWPVFGGKLELAHVAAGREVGVESWAQHFEPACGVRAGNVDELIFEARLNQNLDFRARFPMQRLPYPQIVTNASQTQKESILRVSVLPEKYATGAGKFRTRCRFVLLASLGVCLVARRSTPAGCARPAGASAWAVSSARRRQSRWHRRLTLSSAAILLHSHKRARWRRVPCSGCGYAHMRTMGDILT